MKYIKLFENIGNMKIEVLTSGEFEELYFKIYPEQVDLNSLIHYFSWDGLRPWRTDKHSESIRLITAYNDENILGICFLAWWDLNDHYAISYLSTNKNYFNLGISKKILEETFKYFAKTYPDEVLNFSGYSVEGWKYLHKTALELSKKYNVKIREKAIEYVKKWTDENRELFNKSRKEIEDLYGTYEKLSTVKYSNLDKAIDKIKNKLNSELEKEFSKYLTPAIISIGNKDAKVFLLEPDYGLKITIDFKTYPYRTVANICNIFNESGKWKRGAYTKYSKESQISIEYFVLEYIGKMKINYQKREERLLKKAINKYNL